MFQAKEPELQIVTDEATATTGGQLILVANRLTDDVLLESMIAAGNIERVNKFDAICALVAEQALALKIPEGSKAVVPTAGLMVRQYKRFKSQDDSRIFGGTLVEFRRRLQMATETGDAIRIMDAAMQLGDRATCLTAGCLYENPHIQKIMDEDTIGQYGHDMAQMGYNTALATASRNNHISAAKVIATTIPPLQREFPKVVKLLRAVMNKNIGKVIN